jgi:hypothetical protein
MSALYNINDTVSHSLAEFTTRARDLMQDGPTDDPFIRFVLTGEFIDEDGIARQAFVNSIQTAALGCRLNITRDYDSLLGIADKILIDAPINVYAVPHPTHALTTSIHLKRSISYRGVSPLLDAELPSLLIAFSTDGL